MSFGRPAVFVSVVFAFLAVGNANGQTKPTESGRAYIKKWAATAVSEMHRSGVPASITLAQGMLESAHGKSELATNANNHFGIKCHDWKGKTYSADAETGKECFRKYDKAEESFQDHSDFLRYRDRYKFLFDLKSTDYEGWAYGLRKAGYATDPKYPEKLIGIIEAYGLDQYDTGVLVPESPDAIEAPDGEVFNFSLSRQLYSQNKVAFIYSMEGETYRSIADDYDLRLKELLKFNDLDNEQDLEPGTVVYLEHKKKKASKKLGKYVSEGDESLWEVSQRFALRLKKLAKRNGLDEDYELREEEVVRLR